MGKTNKYHPIKKDRETEKENHYFKIPPKKVKVIEVESEQAPNFIKITKHKTR